MSQFGIPANLLDLKVSETAETLIGSEIIKLAGEIREKIQAGHKIYNLTIGDFNPEIFPIPDSLLEGIIEAYKHKETNYPPSEGILELRKAISRFIHTRLGLEYNIDQILVAGGARPLIYAIYKTILDPGDIVLYHTPSWNNNHYTHLMQAKGVAFETLPVNYFMPVAEDIRPYIQDATLLALCSPLNPTGTVFSRQQLEKICELVLEENIARAGKKKPLYVMYDQVYWTLTHKDNFHHDPVTLYPEMKNFTIYVDGISKAFAATGVRVGWSFGPQKIIEKMKSVLGHMGAWAPKPEQVATAKFLMDDQKVDDYLEVFKNELCQRLDALYHGFVSLREEGFKVDAIPPQAAIYLSVQFDITGRQYNGKVLQNAEDIAGFLLKEANLAIVPFYAFGTSKNFNWFRISVGTLRKEDIPEIIKKLKDALLKLS